MKHISWRNVLQPFDFKLLGRIIVSALVLFVAWAFFLYPATVTLRIATDPQLRTTGQTRLLHGWFNNAARRYNIWAAHYLRSHRGQSVSENDVPGTEWPIFGSAFLLLTAEELTGGNAGTRAMNRDVATAVKVAAQVIADPATGSWVRRKWGEDYLKRENVFYRMLLLMGFAAYERLTADRQYHAFMAEQMRTLADELQQAPFHLRDDYPGECYPSDVLWAVAALQRAGRLEGVHHHALAANIIAVMDSTLRTPHSLPASQVNSRSGKIIQGARGCNTSAIQIMTAELDQRVANQWYDAFVQHFWDGGKWIVGFREMPRGGNDSFMDVDSGPVVGGLGSVASAFGIGAARAVGRFDHATPLTMEFVALSWPTPFGMLTPGILGSLAADGWCLGEIALLFSMSRPAPAQNTHPFTGSVPLIVWALAATYLTFGFLLIVGQLQHWRRRTPYQSGPTC